MASSGRDLEETNTANQAQLLGLEAFDPRQLTDKPLYQGLMTDGDRLRYLAVPIAATDHAITFGITIQTPSRVLDELQQHFNNKRISYVLISESSFSDYQKLYKPPVKTPYKDIELADVGGDQQLEDVKQALDGVRSADMLAYIINQAVRLKASDIHYESTADGTLVRFRVFGVLHPFVKLTKDQYRVLIDAIASASGLSTAAQDAQSGRISKTFELNDGSKVEADLRVETAPTIHGTDIVMRLFNLSASMMSLDSLDFPKVHQKTIDQVVKHPSGLVLVVGPTGSGKTTTLYGVLSELNNPSRKIITLEDPVEVRIEGVSQIPIDSQDGASFADGLRAVLRLDPDVIMVGEIRDDDTAKTALQAALTGHLVLSTYHAPSAAMALVRILDAMAGNPLLLNALRLVVGQRLVRRLDDQTKIAYRPDSRSLKQMRQIVDKLPNEHKPTVNWDKLKIYKPGKSKQNPFGYSSRMPLRELLTVNDELRNELVSQSMVTTADAVSRFITGKNKMMTMLDFGILSVIDGQTTLPEVYRSLG